MRRDVRIAVVAATAGCLVTVAGAGLLWPDASDSPVVVSYGGPSTEAPNLRPLPSPSSPTADTGALPEPSASASEETEEPVPDCTDDCKPADAPLLRDAAPAGEGSLPDASPVTCPEPTHRVADAEQLQAALDEAAPGDTIELSDGEYGGQFVTSASGTSEQPVFLCGSEAAVLDGGDVEDGYVLHLDGAQYWRLVGFSVTNGQKGVMADQTVGTVVQGLTVHGIGDEAIHLRDNSTDNVVLDNTIRDTGLRRDDYGEGVYIGTAVSNWCTYTNCQPDRSDRNVIKGNDIAEVTSEAIDLKEGTTGGAVLDNTFDGSRVTGADSWVDVKGNNYLIEGNTGTTAPEDGFQTHQILDGWGDFNVFRANDGVVHGPGNGISSWPPGANVVTCDNTVSGAGEGLSNIDCT